MSTLLSARELTKSFPSNHLFEGVAIHISEGDRLGVIGPNGGGKSTLLKILATLSPDDRPQQGAKKEGDPEGTYDRRAGRQIEQER